MVEKEQPMGEVLARMDSDGTWRARIVNGDSLLWQCEHLHLTIEEAWECGTRRLDGDD